MPKYQIIFDSADVIPDDEFEEIVKPFITANPNFKFCYANNVMGFRKELIEKRDQYLTERVEQIEKSIVIEKENIENLFDNVADLFKLGD